MLSSRPVDSSHRTPGRALHQHRRENQYGGVASHTANTRVAKSGGVHTVGPSKLRTPGIAKSAQPSRTFKLTEKTPLRSAGLPLLDKTPFTNRAGAHAPHTQRTSKLALISPTTAPLSLSPLPSATRSHTRTQRPSHGPALPQTPAVSGNPWDVSDGSIILGQSTGPDNNRISLEEDDTDDIEYMPPTAIDPPYEPPFDEPDYKEVGKALLQSVYEGPRLDDHEFALPEFVLDPDAIEWESIKLTDPDEDEGDELFFLPGPSKHAAPAKSLAVKQKVPTSGPSASRTASASRPPPTRPTLSKPTTSSSNRVPVVRSRAPLTTSLRAGSTTRPAPPSAHRPAASKLGHSRTASLPAPVSLRPPSKLATSTTTRSTVVRFGPTTAKSTVTERTRASSSALTTVMSDDDGLIKLDSTVEQEQDFMFAV